MEFEVDQKVNFCHMRKIGKCYNLSTLRGAVSAVHENTLTVICRKKSYLVNKNEATHIGERTALTKAMISSN